MCTILGHHISLIRPAKQLTHITSNTWKGAKKSGHKTKKLTLSMKKQIALEMGYKLASQAERS